MLDLEIHFEENKKEQKLEGRESNGLDRFLVGLKSELKC